MDKRSKRVRRSRRTRATIKRLGAETGIARLTVHRTTQHIYVQVLAPVGGKVLAQASSLELRKNVPEGGKIGVATSVGGLIAERAKNVGVARVACDRSGFKYHGRVAALIGAAREAGLIV